MKMKTIMTCLFLMLCAGAIVAPAHSAVTPGQALIKARKVLTDVGMQSTLPLQSQGEDNWGLPIRISRASDGSGTEKELDPDGKTYFFKFLSPTSKDDNLISIDIDVQSGEVVRFNQTSPYDSNKKASNSLTREQCIQKALSWMRSVGQPLNASFALYDSYQARSGVEALEWRKRVKAGSENLFLPPAISMSMNKSTGEVISYLKINFKVSIDSFVPKITKLNATKLAQQKIIASQGKWNDSSVPISNLFLWQVPAYDKAPLRQYLAWNVRINGTRKVAGLSGVSFTSVIWDVTVDADSGEIIGVSFKDPPENARNDKTDRLNMEKSTLKFKYLKPVWDKNSTVEAFVLSSSSEEDNTNAITLNGKTVIQFNASKPPHISANQHRISFTAHKSIYILDLRSHSIGRIGDDNRVVRTHPMFNPTNNDIAFSGNHPNSDDQDIFVATIASKLSIVSEEKLWCVSHMTGPDILPVFSPDGKWIVFAHQDKADEESGAINTWSLYRVASDKSHRLPDYKAPQLIVAKMPKPERISVFPDGKRVLVSYEGNEYAMKIQPEIVDIGAKTRRVLKWPVLRDPDFPKGKPLIPQELVISPDGKQVAWSAQRWSGNPKDSAAVCIYTCNLDGTGLKRITPPVQKKVEVYKYPQPGVTALNAWEKLQPKHNTGTFHKAGEETEWEKILRERGPKPGSPDAIPNGTVLGQDDKKAEKQIPAP